MKKKLTTANQWHPSNWTVNTSRVAHFCFPFNWTLVIGWTKKTGSSDADAVASNHLTGRRYLSFFNRSNYRHTSAPNAINTVKFRRFDISFQTNASRHQLYTNRCLVQKCTYSQHLQEENENYFLSVNFQNSEQYSNVIDSHERTNQTLQTTVTRKLNRITTPMRLYGSRVRDEVREADATSEN